MRTVRTVPIIGMIACLMLLAALASTIGLIAGGWVVGIGCGSIMNLALGRGLARCGGGRMGPADQVTLIRATLVAGVAALTADSFGRPVPTKALVALISVALVLDAVDGWVARRTETASPLGARFDMEVDAFLIFILSVYVARHAGVWVLAIGAARYAFVVVGWLLPWMRGQLPPRYWRKVVAATQGVVLTVAVADALPRWWTDAAIAIALAMLAESFGRDVWWLWAHRQIEPRQIAPRQIQAGQIAPRQIEAGQIEAGQIEARPMAERWIIADSLVNQVPVGKRVGTGAHPDR